MPTRAISSGTSSTGSASIRRGAVMIGDRKHDAIGARANGIASIGVTWGYGSRQELKDAGAACLVDDPQGLEEAILTLAASTPRPAATA